MVRIKIDNRISVLIQNGAISNHRSLFVVVGDKGRDQVGNSQLGQVFRRHVILGRARRSWDGVMYVSPSSCRTPSTPSWGDPSQPPEGGSAKKGV